MVTNPAIPAAITVDGVQRDTWGLNWVPFPVGPHQVCFGAVPGFITPSCTSITSFLGSTATVQGNYVATGYVRAITSPAVPSTISVDGVPRNDWGLWTEVAVGTHSVCFGAVAKFDPPTCRDVTVTAGATATTTGTFTANASASGPGGTFGYLRATTSPAVNAMISVDGLPRNTWGLDWVKLSVGSHQVCFGPALATTAPTSCQTATIANGATTVLTGTYTPRGSLRVLTSPAVPATIAIDGQIANAYGVWTDVAPGNHTVCFGPVRGYTTPPCVTGVAVVGGALTTRTGTYTPRS